MKPSAEQIDDWTSDAFLEFPEDESSDLVDLQDARDEYLATHAAQWAADAQLEKCCEWLYEESWRGLSNQLRAAMRPKPPSLKQQALSVLDDCADSIGAAHENALRRALEQLPE